MYQIGKFGKNKLDLPCPTLLFSCWQYLAHRGWGVSSAFSGAHSHSGRVGKSDSELQCPQPILAQSP